MLRKREMGVIKGFDKIREERKNLTFFKTFQSADLSSETMRAFPFDFMTRLSDKDLSDKMVIRAKWGSSWEVGVSKNPRFYYMERLGWNQFVSDNLLGENEFVTFTHKGKMSFNVNIYEQNGKEMIVPRNLHKLGSSSQVKKEQGESSYKDVKKEEETGESPGVVKEKRVLESKTSKRKIRKRVVNSVAIGEPSGGVKRRGTKKKDEESKTSKKMIKSDMSAVRTFTVTNKESSYHIRSVPKDFVEHLPDSKTMITIYDSDKNRSWEVRCTVREAQAAFTKGWTKVVREYPLSIGDVCTFQHINPTEFILDTSKD